MHDALQRHHRRSIRLKGYDYAQPGAYFLTICTQHRACLLGDIFDDTVRLSKAGAMVQTVWSELPTAYAGVETDAFIVMPNHIHGIVILTGEPVGMKMKLSDVVHRFKTLTTKRYTEGVQDFGWPPFAGRLWQRNYWEHVIRDERSLDLIRQYIADNPARWTEDPENPVNTQIQSSNQGQPHDDRL